MHTPISPEAHNETNSLGGAAAKPSSPDSGRRVFKERPILFSAPMVRAILDGTKTQTRRVVKEENVRDVGAFAEPVFIASRERKCKGRVVGHEDVIVRCPYGKPGDRLWVKEAYWKWGKWVPNGKTKSGRTNFRFVPVGQSIRYCADGSAPKQTAKRDGECGWVYRHARYMPKADSRIGGTITDVRVQRLQDISEEDALAEGSYLDRCPCLPRSADRKPLEMAFREEWCHVHGNEFKNLWDSINGDGAWDANPWVWALTFERVECAA